MLWGVIKKKRKWYASYKDRELLLHTNKILITFIVTEKMQHLLEICVMSDYRRLNVKTNVRFVTFSY